MRRYLRWKYDYELDQSAFLKNLHINFLALDH